MLHVARLLALVIILFGLTMLAPLVVAFWLSDPALYAYGESVVCSFAMLLGRLELFTLLIVLTPGFWRK